MIYRWAEGGMGRKVGDSRCRGEAVIPQVGLMKGS